MEFSKALQLAASSFGGQEFRTNDFAMVVLINFGGDGRVGLEKTKSQRIKMCSNDLDRLFRMGLLIRRLVKRQCRTRTGKSCCRGRCYLYGLSARGRNYLEYKKKHPIDNLVERALDLQINIMKDPIAYQYYKAFRKHFPDLWTFDNVCANLVLYLYPELRYGRQRRFLPRIDMSVVSALFELLKGQDRPVIEHPVPADKTQDWSGPDADPVMVEKLAEPPGQEPLAVQKSPHIREQRATVPKEHLDMALSLIRVLKEIITLSEMAYEKRDRERLDVIHMLLDNLPWAFRVDERGVTDGEKRQKRRDFLLNTGFSEKEIEECGDLSKIAPVELYNMALLKIIPETVLRVCKENMTIRETKSAAQVIDEPIGQYDWIKQIRASLKGQPVAVYVAVFVILELIPRLKTLAKRKSEAVFQPDLFEKAVTMMQDSQHPLTLKIENGKVTDLG